MMETIEQHETSRHKHRLHLAAVQAALARERRLKLPAALLAPFQAWFLPSWLALAAKNSRVTQP